MSDRTDSSLHIPRRRLTPWSAGLTPLHCASLQDDQRADVVIVGAGIAGMITAYLLAREGKSVVVLDSGPVGGGVTGRTTAHLKWATAGGFHEIVRLHGAEGAQAAVDAHRAAIDLIESIVGREEIVCDFRRLDGYLSLGAGQSAELLAREMEALRRAQILGVYEVERTPWARHAAGPALRYEAQGRFHPLKFLHGLAAAVQRHGGRIFTDAHVTHVLGGAQVVVDTKSRVRISAGAAVVATNSPINDLVITQVKQAPWHACALALRVPKGATPDALYWDTLPASHTARLQEMPESPDQELLIVGGEFSRGETDNHPEQRLLQLEEWAREYFPMATTREYAWSGMVLKSMDGLAFIGRTPSQEPNVYIATGDSGMGLTHGAIAAILLSDLITSGAHPWAELFDPLRLRLGSLGVMARESLGAATEGVRRPKPAEITSPAELPPDSGALMQNGQNKVAVYRDREGGVYILSAFCAHLGCLVAWNDAAKVWECACHGSRFDRFGRVLHGPAVGDLRLIARE